ncbi:class D sortase [Povalibacter sp.]|uniref:class D sortase n=1 Tax=Povalibacter sp. TaxID=1962978 RepID=UPI002D1FA498|nr:class D sortase [Povalibacter sp.]
MTRVLEIFCWTAGGLLLATYAGVRAWSAYASEDGIDALRQARDEHAAYVQQIAAATPAPPAAGGEARTLQTSTPDTSLWNARRLQEYKETLSHKGVPEGVLRIPKLKLEVPVYEGTSDFTLNRGAGRIEGTADIDSASGNIGIAAHRDGFFRPLKDIAVGDTLLLETLTATREYRVTRLDIVDPDNVSVLAPTTSATITLVTCYPFYFVGSAPQRFIVHARAEPQTAGG